MDLFDHDETQYHPTAEERREAARETPQSPELIKELCPECRSRPGFAHRMDCSRNAARGLRFNARSESA